MSYHIDGAGSEVGLRYAAQRLRRPEATSWSIALSRCASANSFFNLVFSRSSSLPCPVLLDQSLRLTLNLDQFLGGQVRLMPHRGHFGQDPNGDIRSGNTVTLCSDHTVLFSGGTESIGEFPQLSKSG